MKEVDLKNIKNWCAISCPTTGVRFDARTLELLDTDHDGHIRTPEILAALEVLRGAGVKLENLGQVSDQDKSDLDSVVAKQAALAGEEATELEKAALVEWEARGKTAEVAVLGENTATAEAVLKAIEPVVDGFFTPPDDMPLVTEEAERVLPLADHINPKYADAIFDFAEKCVKPLLGANLTALTRREFRAVQAKLAPYRAWVAARPVMNPVRHEELLQEERILRYKLHLGELLENYVTMDRLYDRDQWAIFQMGTLRIDGREMELCFHVADEAAHSALVGKSNCCVIYLKLMRPSESAVRNICTVVTAGRVGTLYVGRNGVFYDRDGKDWEATVTKVVENQVSLIEAFWSPWRKIGEGISGAVRKMLGDKQTKAVAEVQKGVESTQAGGAALASSVAALGIGFGMLGAAAASVISAVKGLHPWWMILVALAAIVLIVSVPSMILAYFKLRKRDLGAILNASGWAINRPLPIKSL